LKAAEGSRAAGHEFFSEATTTVATTQFFTITSKKRGKDKPKL
jgi:hypothetical protein